jgi:hypothetical protein
LRQHVQRLKHELVTKTPRFGTNLILAPGKIMGTIESPLTSTLKLSLPPFFADDGASPVAGIVTCESPSIAAELEVTPLGEAADALDLRGGIFERRVTSAEEMGRVDGRY